MADSSTSKMVSATFGCSRATIDNIMSPPGLLNQKWSNEQLLKAGVDPDQVAIVESIRQIVSYDVPQGQESPFQHLQQFVSTRQLESLAPWRGHHRTTKQRWFFGCYVGISNHVRGALAAAYYHADRLREIQERVNLTLAEPRVKTAFTNGSWGLGYTWTLDFEYQALVLAIRRCLDYLAGALACYFLREADSFRTFPRSIAKTRYPEVAAALTEAHARHVSQLSFVLAPGRASIRHRIAHYEFLPVGCVNLGPNGFSLVGGPEDPSRPPKGDPVNLNEALQGRLDSLYACVEDMIETFLQAVRTNDSAVS